MGSQEPEHGNPFCYNDTHADEFFKAMGFSGGKCHPSCVLLATPIEYTVSRWKTFGFVTRNSKSGLGGFRRFYSTQSRSDGFVVST